MRFLKIQKQKFYFTVTLETPLLIFITYGVIYQGLRCTKDCSLCVLFVFMSQLLFIAYKGEKGHLFNLLNYSALFCL